MTFMYLMILLKKLSGINKRNIIGGDKPPTVDNVEEEFPWYYISDIT